MPILNGECTFLHTIKIIEMWGQSQLLDRSQIMLHGVWAWGLQNFMASNWRGSNVNNNIELPVNYWFKMGLNMNTGI